MESHIIPVDNIGNKQKRQMFALMQKYYDHVSWNTFISDLNRKTIAICLFKDGGLKGFSTQLIADHTIEGTTLTVLFSGDTIVERECWHTNQLSIAWVRLALSIADREPCYPLYWLLTTKGFRTYRFLSVFFHEYHPCWSRSMPDSDRYLIQTLGSRMFGSRFNPQTLIIPADDGSQRLRAGVADVTEQRKKNRHINFFNEINPGHADGDELVCIARCNRENLSDFILKRAEKP